MHKIGKEQKIVIVTVGLPACGKTFLCMKLNRFVNWLGYDAEVFSVADYRRKLIKEEFDSDFFDPFNRKAFEQRQECAQKAMEDLIKYLQGEGDLAIYDGTNYTRNRRFWIEYTIHKNIKNVSILFIESLITDEKILEKNIKFNKLNSPDYKSWDESKAVQDYVKKLQNYKNAYETIKESENISYIKVFNQGENFEINKIHGYLQSKIVSFIMNLHFFPRPIFFSRHGQSLYNVDDRVGGDPDLSKEGYKYAEKLNLFMQKQFPTEESRKNVLFLTSTLKRAYTTAGHIKIGIDPIKMKCLEEINCGTCDGMTYEDIAKKYPFEHSERKLDKLGYRYPRGESYLDLIHRIEPVIFEIERQADPVIIVAHQAVLRCLYAYFTCNDKAIINEVPHMDVPLHCVFKLEPQAFSVRELRYNINIENGEYTEQEFKAKDLIRKTGFLHFA